MRAPARRGSRPLASMPRTSASRPPRGSSMAWPAASRKRTPQRMGHACAAVDRGAAADADDDLLDAGVERATDQLAGAARGGEHRVALGGRQQLQAARLRHLDDGRAAVAAETPRGGDRPAERVAYLPGAGRPRRWPPQGPPWCPSPPSAMGMSTTSASGAARSRPAGDGGGGLGGGEGFLQRIGGNDDLHGIEQVRGDAPFYRRPRGVARARRGSVTLTVAAPFSYNEGTR